MKMIGETKIAMLIHAQHLPNVEHSLTSDSCLCDDGHIVECSEKNCVVKKNWNVIASCELSGGM